MILTIGRVGFLKMILTIVLIQNKNVRIYVLYIPNVQALCSNMILVLVKCIVIYSLLEGFLVLEILNTLKNVIKRRKSPLHLSTNLESEDASVSWIIALNQVI